jgi:membrane fusion protein, multidrug efflux system
MIGRTGIAWVVASASAGLCACAGQSKRAPRAESSEVGVITVRRQSLTLTEVLPGRTAPYAVSEVRPQVSGIILKRLYTEGSEIKAGQILYQIDPQPYRAAYHSAQAALANARASLVTAKATAERDEKLLQPNLVSAQQYDTAMGAYRQAQALVEQQAANLETARINLEYTSVRAPISGRAGISNVTPGALVTTGQPNALTTIQQLDPIYVDIPQSSSQLVALKRSIASGALKAGSAASAKVTLELEDGSRYPETGTLQFTDVTVDPTTGTVMLRAIFPNPRTILLPGMYVRAKVVEGTDPRAILVPQQGVSHDIRGRPTAWVVETGDKVKLRMLTVSRSVGNQWLVTQGLEAGDRVVMQGTQKLRPGIKVRPVVVHLSEADQTPPD